MTLHYTATEADTGRTLFSVLRYRLHMSAGLIKRLKYQTRFLVNGAPRHTDYRVAPGDTIAIQLPPETSDFPTEPGPLTVLYEDEALLAVKKPAGIIIHPSATRNTGTLANRILSYLGGGAVHPVGRLDRDTTGVALFSKNGYISSIMTDAMHRGAIYKTYLAPVFGALPETEGVIDLPIDRVSPTSLWRCIRDAGQPARTSYTLLKSGSLWSLYAFHPLTGRTHQIRLHCMASGAPILGDPVYATDASRAYSDGLGLAVQQLCCVKLAFPHPMTGTALCVETEPDFFQASWFLAP